MYNLPINRDNDSWAKINNQFFKGGFAWYNQRVPDRNRWYYNYYILGEGERICCLEVAWFRRRSKVTTWLRNIEKFEEIKEKYEKEDKENKKKEDKKEDKKEGKTEDKKEDKKEDKWWLRRCGDSNNSMSWRRTKYGQ